MSHVGDEMLVNGAEGADLASHPIVEPIAIVAI